MEILSYVSDWQDFIKYISEITRYCLITLYIPPNPIGFIKSFEDLANEAAKHFKVEKEVVVDKSLVILMLGKKDRL
jgi:hypothetical protein